MTTRLLVLAPLAACLLLALGSGIAVAQRPGQPSPEEIMRRMQDPEAMRRMAEQAQAMQACMKGIDQKKLDALQEKAMAGSKEIKSLCDAGKRDQALDRAMALAKDMHGDPTFKQVQACTRDMSDLVVNMPWAGIPGVDEDDPKPTDDDVCR